QRGLRGRADLLLATMTRVLILVALLAGDAGWRKVPDRYQKTIKELCAPLEVKWGRRCVTQEVIDLHCMFTPGPPPPGRGGSPGGGAPHKYEDFIVDSCTSNAARTSQGVVWDAMYCDRPSKAPYPECGAGRVVSRPKKKN